MSGLNHFGKDIAKSRIKEAIAMDCYRLKMHRTSLLYHLYLDYSTTKEITEIIEAKISVHFT